MDHEHVTGPRNIPVLRTPEVAFPAFDDAKGERLVKMRCEFLACVLRSQDIHRAWQNPVSGATGKRHEATPRSILSALPAGEFPGLRLPVLDLAVKPMEREMVFAASANRCTLILGLGRSGTMAPSALRAFSPAVKQEYPRK
jgi:hypothetical protein